MPVTYRIDRSKQLIHTRCTGAVVLEEVRRHFVALTRDKECPPRLDVLLDLSEMATLPESDQLRTVTGDIRAPPPSDPVRYLCHRCFQAATLWDGPDVRGLRGAVLLRDGGVSVPSRRRWIGWKRSGAEPWYQANEIRLLRRADPGRLRLVEPLPFRSDPSTPRRSHGRFP